MFRDQKVVETAPKPLPQFEPTGALVISDAVPLRPGDLFFGADPDERRLVRELSATRSDLFLSPVTMARELTRYNDVALGVAFALLFEWVVPQFLIVGT